jgi:hypothetical protein
MTGSAMPVTNKTGRTRKRLAACALSFFVSSLAIVSIQAFAADPPASSSPSISARAKAMQEQVDKMLGAADGTGTRSAVPAPGPAPAAAGAEPAATAPGAADTRSLDENTQQLKKDVVDLNRDLFVLEEELLFPANTQVAVYISMDVGEFFALDSITLKIDNKEVTNYLYTPREVDALLKGGVQRLYLGNLKVGNHELVAFFSGKGPDNRDYRRGASLKFDKSIGAKYLELKIEDRQRKMQPEFEIKDWE